MPRRLPTAYPRLTPEKWAEYYRQAEAEAVAAAAAETQADAAAKAEAEAAAQALAAAQAAQALAAAQAAQAQSQAQAAAARAEQLREHLAAEAQLKAENVDALLMGQLLQNDGIVWEHLDAAFQVDQARTAADDRSSGYIFNRDGSDDGAGGVLSDEE